MRNIGCFPATTEAANVPVVLHEPGILARYRPINQPWRYYFCSLFQLHNETVNVWTHLIGTVVLWTVLENYSDRYDIWNSNRPLLIFGVCAMTNNLCSSVVHLVHSKSPTVHYHAILIDYIGVAVYSFGTGIMTFYSNSDRQLYDILQNYYMPFLVVVTWINFTCVSTAKVVCGEDPYSIKRKVLQVGSMSLQAVLVILPFAPRYWHCYGNNVCSMSSLNHLTVCIVFFALEAFFFGCHLPEKLFPGKCDIIGQGHHFFHVLVTTNQIAQLHAIVVDFEDGMSEHCQLDIITLWSCLGVLMSAILVTFIFLRQLIPKDPRKQN